MQTLTSSLSSVPSMPQFLRITRPVLIAFLALFCLLSSAVLYYYSGRMVERDLQEWQVRLNLLAHMRADAVERWIEQQRHVLESLAQTKTLQVALERWEEEPARVESLPFFLESLSMRGNVAGVLAAQNFSEFALFDRTHDRMVATSGFPKEDAKIRYFLSQVALGDAVAISPFFTVDSDSAMRASVLLFVAPIPLSSSDAEMMVVGMAPADSTLFSLLASSYLSERSLEAVLISPGVDPNTVLYHSPLRALQDAVMAEDQSALFALSSPNQNAVLPDYTGKEVLVTGRMMVGAPWVLMQTIEYAEAMQESLSRRSTLWVVGVIAILAITAGMLGMWFYGVSERYRQLAQHYAAQHALTRTIADHKPEALYIVDADNRCHFANREAWRRSELRSEPTTLALQMMLPRPRFDIYAAANERAQREQMIISYLHQEISSEGKRIQTQVRHIPLKQIPSLYRAEGSVSGVLILEQDFSELLASRERLTDTLHALMDTLVSLMDRRDHNASGHSVRVALLAVALAKELRLTPVEVETIDIAARLMNLGKMLVPSALLTKREGLTPEEEKTLQLSLQKSADLIEGIAFEGPVRETILQSRENLNGTGQRGLQGDQILLSAKIIRVANDFISMISPRSYRKPLSVEIALTELERFVDVRYDSRVMFVLRRHLGETA